MLRHPPKLRLSFGILAVTPSTAEPLTYNLSGDLNILHPWVNGTASRNAFTNPIWLPTVLSRAVTLLGVKLKPLILPTLAYPPTSSTGALNYELRLLPKSSAAVRVTCRTKRSPSLVTCRGAMSNALQKQLLQLPNSSDPP